MNEAKDTGAGPAPQEARPVTGAEDRTTDAHPGCQQPFVRRFSSNRRQFPTMIQALAYEAHGSWWVGFVPGDSWLGEMVAKYLAWKIRRRFKRIEQSIQFERKARITNPDWWDNSDA